MDKHRGNKEIATYVKLEFDKRHLEPQAEGAYHCIVGKHFASRVLAHVPVLHTWCLPDLSWSVQKFLHFAYFA